MPNEPVYTWVVPGEAMNIYLNSRRHRILDDGTIEPVDDTVGEDEQVEPPITGAPDPLGNEVLLSPRSGRLSSGPNSRMQEVLRIDRTEKRNTVYVNGPAAGQTVPVITWETHGLGTMTRVDVEGEDYSEASFYDRPNYALRATEAGTEHWVYVT